MSLNIAVLAGGVGAAKFVSGLARAVDPDRLTIISNTGDDIVRHGLAVSPDVDIMIYTLAGLVDSDKGWGVRGDTFDCLRALGDLGEEVWFNLGDRDLATHILRTSLLNEGRTPTEIAARLCERLGCAARVLPMTDERVATEVRTERGWIHFQELIVKHQNILDVQDVRFTPAAHPTKQVFDAIAGADVILIAPSNPIASIGPILHLGGPPEQPVGRGVRAALRSSGAPCVAVCPIIGGQSLKGPSDKMLRALGFEVNAIGVARCYEDIIDGMVIDAQDEEFAAEIQAMGLRVAITDTVMRDDSAKIAVARAALELAREIGAGEPAGAGGTGTWGRGATDPAGGRGR